MAVTPVRPRTRTGTLLSSVLPSPSSPLKLGPQAYTVACPLLAGPVSFKPIAAAPKALDADVLAVWPKVAGEVPAICTPGRDRPNPVVALPGTAAASNATTIIKINKLDRDNVRKVLTHAPTTGRAG